MQVILAIAFGGALGAVLRYLLNNSIEFWFGSAFPYGILFINILGCFLMGVFVSLFANFWEPGQPLKMFFTVGLLGAFTTFSAFSLDTFLLIEKGAFLEAGLYIFMSVFFTIASLMAGMFLIKVFI
jgi:CrcB protein